MRIKSDGKKYDVVCYAPINSLTPSTLAVLPEVGVIPVSEFADYEYADTEQVLTVTPARWKAKNGVYYFVNERGKIDSSVSPEDSYSKQLFKSGNYFKTEAQALEAEAEISGIFLALAEDTHSCRAQYGKSIFYVDDACGTDSIPDFGGLDCRHLFERGNYFLNREDAELYAERVLDLLEEIQRRLLVENAE